MRFLCWSVGEGSIASPKHQIIHTGFPFVCIRRARRGAWQWGPLGNLGVSEPPYELEVAFQTPSELEILNLELQLKAKINTGGEISWNPTRAVRLVILYEASSRITPHVHRAGRQPETIIMPVRRAG